MIKPLVYVIIPAYNEEKSIAKVIAHIPQNIVSEIIVCNNNSHDNTAAVATAAGATVVFEAKAGYGNACLKGISYLKNKAQANDIVVFMDADFSDYPEEIIKIIAPLQANIADVIIGSRSLGKRERGAMTVPQIFGNWLATHLIYIFYKVKFTDLGPFRAIKWGKLMALNMQDKTYGFTVEMQVKSAKQKFICLEVPVNYRKRIGTSKISGTVKGVILAGYKIIFTIFKNM
ncbi:MAG: glycosyltransferase family 2 protein [Sphingobacteriales bacterium]|nr:MAG: glycosyltransferase family 2 protein [Sphingobacteriales bacterium]TAF81889.1 MAG: glycosyltransferase family 2 protein [Sphingobacteriales bacterium]